MRNEDLYSSLIKLHILYHASREAIFGLGIIKELSRHGYKLSPGTLYPILHALEQKGDLRSEKKKANARIRRNYRITKQGQQTLKAAKKKIKELFGELFRGE